MKRLHLAVLLAGIATGCQVPGTPPPPTQETHLPGQVLVRFEAETSDAARAALRAKYGAQGVEALPSGTERWHVAGAPLEVAGAIAREAGIKAAQPNWERRLQVLNPQDIDYQNSKQWHLKDGFLAMRQIWGDSDYGTMNVTGKGVIVAVVDSGVDMSHPDLVPNIAKAQDGSPAHIDLVNDEYTYPKMDGNGHGTHVAGIIAAAPATDSTTYYGKGNVLGVAPEAKILPVQVMKTNGGGDDFNIAKGIEEAVKWRGQNDSRVHLINLSIGGDQPSPTLAASLAFASQNNVLVIAAAGNYNMPVYYPAAYPGALAVGALNPRNERASYSCYGPQLAVMAPGGADPHEPSESVNGWGGIYSTFPTYANYSKQEYYGAQAGTSMAAPVVAGIAALILSENPGLTPDQLSMRLVATADDMGAPGFDNLTGWGRVNPKRALEWTQHDGRTP